ncbi:MAG: trypsin-like peptidase domain-containing protein [Fimbriimonadales bacterium]|nr:trypsin-like peptidase domain-containing protein [Fimbriimonadales bacterium]
MERGMQQRQKVTTLGLAALGALVAGCNSAPPTPSTMDATMIADMAKPATVVIQTTYNAQLSVPSVGYNEANLQQLSYQVQMALSQGADPNQVLDAVINELLSNLESYLVPTQPFQSVNAQIDGVGSGFFVTEDGYVVTNAHVVTDDPNQLNVALAENALAQLIEQDVKDFTQELGGRVTEQQIEMLKQAAVNFYVKYMQIGPISRSVAVHLGANVPGVASMTKPVQAEVLQNALGEPIPGKDVAILKVAGQDFVTLDIGDDTSLSVGDEIFPYGYPADATFFPAFDPSSINEASFTRGMVSSRKQMQGGWEVIQTDAAIRGGNSGGPVFDKSGKVIGLSTFGLRDMQTGAMAQGANFVVPMTVVKEFLQRANVTPKHGKTTELWQEAVLLRSADRHSEAVERLKKIETLKPGMPAVQARLQQSQKAIVDGKDKSGSPIMMIVLVAVGVVVVLGIVLMMLKAKGGKSIPGGGPPPQVPGGQNPRLPG